MTLLHSLWSRVVFAYDFDRQTSGGLLYDHGPLALHATAGAGAAAPTRQLGGSYTLDGGDYWTLPLRFYDAAPTGAHSWLVVGGSTATAAAVARVFSCWNSTAGGVDKGTLLGLDTTATNQRVRAYQCQGAAAQPYTVSAAAAPYLMRAASCAALTVETTPRGFHDTAVASYSWGAGAIGTASYDNTLVPRIGMDPAGTNALTGQLRYLALLDGAVSTPDLLTLSQMMRDGGKPFCCRG